jgi:hypothetical protein
VATLTAYKAVDGGLKSPLVGPNADGSLGLFGGRQITYSMGGDFVAAGTGSDGIWAAPTLDDVVAFISPLMNPQALRYLEVSYDTSDVIVTRDNGSLSLAAVHVVNEAFLP